MAQDPMVQRGIRRCVNEPGVLLAEITWRWTAGLAGLALLFLCSMAFLRSIRVTEAENLALRSGNAFWIAEGLSQMFRGSGRTLLRIAAIVLPAYSLIWCVTATLGRAATLRMLLRESDGGAVTADGGPKRVPNDDLMQLFRIHFLRVCVALAALIGVVGASLLAGRAAVSMTRAGEPQINVPLLYLVLLSGWMAIGVFWAFLNWLLSIAPIFLYTGEADAGGAIAEAVHAFQQHAGRFSAAGVVFGLVRLAALFAVIVVSAMPLGLAGHAPPIVIGALIGLISLGYFAVADFLYVARLAAYLEILGAKSGGGVASEALPGSGLRGTIVSRDAGENVATGVGEDALPSAGPQDPMAVESGGGTNTL